MDKLNRITITDIKDIVTVFSPKGRLEKMNNRKCYGLSFCSKGQITYTHNGKKYVSDPQHAIILPKGQSYSIHGDKSGVFAVINFECADFLCNTMMTLAVRDVESIMSDFEQMKKLFVFEINRTKVMSIFYNVIHNLSASDISEHNILYPAIKFLENNYSAPNLTNTTLADQCNISEVYFRKLFIKTYGIPPKQFIIEMRINKAKRLLTEGVLKINSVSEQCGFSNPYHFSHLFKQKTGSTPTEFMKSNKIYKI